MLTVITEVSATTCYLRSSVPGGAEQDHRSVEQRIYPVPGFENFRNATAAISGIGLTQEIRESRFDIEKFPSGVKERAPRRWEAGLAA